MLFSAKFALALLIDWLCGDPRWLPHPIRAIGWYCLRLEGMLRRRIASPGRAGLWLVIVAVATTVLALGSLLLLASCLSPLVAELLALYLLYSSLAMRDLVTHSEAVYQALAVYGDIPRAQQEVARIVGRDTAQLDAEGVSRACVESVAENTVDGITAPVFWALLGSLLPAWGGLSPLAMAALGAYFYKTANTMDSLFGYKNERYLDFGRAAALFDDRVNFLPARLTGLAMVGSAWVLGFSASGAMKILLRDRLAHASPNSGHTEAAVAGALGIQLGGTSWYFGQQVAKPVIGDAGRPVQTEDIRRVNRLMMVATLLFTAAMLALRALLAAG